MLLLSLHNFWETGDGNDQPYDVSEETEVKSLIQGYAVNKWQSGFEPKSL